MVPDKSISWHHTYRAICNDEIGSDAVDFNIQRLGLWIAYDQKSCISEKDWLMTEAKSKPGIKGKLYVGIKFGVDGLNTSMSIAARTNDGRIFVSAYDCRPQREGVGWIIDFIKRAKAVHKVVIDGKSGQQMLVEAMANAKIKAPVIPGLAEIIAANSKFEDAIFNDGLWHMIQPSLDFAVTHSEHRTIGSNGGFGFKATTEECDISLMDSAILAYWLCDSTKELRARKISY